MKSDILRAATLTGSQAKKKASLRLFDWSEPRVLDVCRSGPLCSMDCSQKVVCMAVAGGPTQQEVCYQSNRGGGV